MTPEKITELLNDLKDGIKSRKWIDEVYIPWRDSRVQTEGGNEDPPPPPPHSGGN